MTLYRHDYYDRDGHGITKDRAWDLRSDAKYVRVGRTRIAGHLISTVWTGTDQRLDGQGGEVPLIFETLIFPPGSWVEMYRELYPTSHAARAGHDQAVMWLREELLTNGVRS